MAMISNGDGLSGNLNNFELMAECLPPCDPVANRKTRKGGSDAHTNIAEKTADTSSISNSGNPAIGKT